MQHQAMQLYLEYLNYHNMKFVKHKIDNSESNLPFEGAEVIILDQNEISDMEIEQEIREDLRAHLKAPKKLKYYAELLPLFIKDLRSGVKITLNGFVYTIYKEQP